MTSRSVEGLAPSTRAGAIKRGDAEDQADIRDVRFGFFGATSSGCDQDVARDLTQHVCRDRAEEDVSGPCLGEPNAFRGNPRGTQLAEVARRRVSRPFLVGLCEKHATLCADVAFNAEDAPPTETREVEAYLEGAATADKAQGSSQRTPVGVSCQGPSWLLTIEIMRAVTIKEAKARLNDLVEAATSGEQVVIMKGSKHVAAIVPLTDADLEISPRLTDDQAARLWKELAREQAAGRVASFDSAEQAIAFLKGPRRKAPRKSRR